MRRLKLKSWWWLAIVAAITLTACGSDPVDDVQGEIDPPREIELVDEEEGISVEVMDGDEEVGEPTADLDGDGTADDADGEATEKGGPVSETVMQQLYLMDSNGLVAPQSLTIPKGENEIERVVEYLVKGGPVTEILPNGFQAVLPSGTEILDTSVSDGVATLNFSNEFTDYSPEQELQVLQALTWTVTQIDDIERVRVKLDGKMLDMMPKNGTPIGNGYTRAHGINLEMSEQVDLVHTKPVIIYFLAQEDEKPYYVPVARRISQDEQVYQAVIGELLNGPSVLTDLQTDFDKNVELLEEPKLVNGTLTLNFSEQLLNKDNGEALSTEVLNMLVLSLTEQNEVKNVSLQVESNDTIQVSTGEVISKPVTRPDMVNTGEY